MRPVTDDFHPSLTMESILARHPGARRVLFAAFHIGGCQSCAYQPTDTLAAVCQKNEIPLDEALTSLRQSRQHDLEMLISPEKLHDLITSEAPLTLLDTRTREEFEAIPFPKAQLMTQDLQNHLFAHPPTAGPIILIDHLGRSVLDHCAWFRGHGLKETFGLDGGIDRYAQEIDPSLQRYRLELD